MKRLFTLILAVVILFSLPVFAEEAKKPVPEAVPAEEAEEGDDSDPVPIDMMDDGDELEIEEAVLPGHVLQYGDTGDDVLALQTRLTELKYYTGNLSGRYREGTRKAVETFQEDFELDQTGVADLRTMSILYSIVHRPLRFGSKGEDVKELQRQLSELGYFTGKIDGNYISSTQKAVEALQKKNGLEVTGVADSDLQDMISQGKILGKSDKPDDTDTPAPNLSNFLVDDNENSVWIPDEPVTFTKKLKYGSSGKLVKEMQIRLAEVGYYEGPISGNFQKYTTRAVKAIQTQNGLEATGEVDETTWNVIFNEGHLVLPEHTPKPTPSPTPVPFAITVDVANQVTTVYGRDENGEYTEVVRQMLCSTGMKATPSDVGDWVLNGRHATWCIFPKWGNSYARYWTRINGSIAFHSPIYTSVSNSAMKIGSYNKLGQRASHGCIRLSVWDAKWIYDNIGAGTVVSIVEGMEPDPELRDSLKLPPLDKKYCTPISTPVPTAEPEFRAENVPQIGKRNLKARSEGEDVYWLQSALKELGYYDTKVTGKMLARTEKAVKAFQKAHAIYQTGTANQELLNKIADELLKKREAESAGLPEESAGPKETPAP